jgi:hypothetical protein
MEGKSGLLDYLIDHLFLYKAEGNNSDADARIILLNTIVFFTHFLSINIRKALDVRRYGFPIATLQDFS